jgi:3D (Asp-Asp-Asp) domain-containing protein
VSDILDKPPTARRRSWVAIVATCVCAVAVVAWSAAGALVPPIQEVAGISIWVLLGKAEQAQHPLADVVRRVIAGETGEQPPWKLPMLVNGLRKGPLDATITAYTEMDPGCTTRTAWGSRVRRGIVAADRRYWGPGSVVWIGPPISETLIVEDVGSAIKGPHRFDVCLPGDLDGARAIGLQRHITYIPLHREPPRRRWSAKPKEWHPPVWKPGIPAPGQEAEEQTPSPATTDEAMAS